jgi:hypothetical protein
MERRKSIVFQSSGLKQELHLQAAFFQAEARTCSRLLIEGCRAAACVRARHMSEMNALLAQQQIYRISNTKSDS